MLKRAKPPFGADELRLVAQYALGTLSHDLACRLAKRHGFEPSKKGQEWEHAEKARSLYKTANGAALAVFVWEAMLLSLAAQTTETDDDLLAEAAKLYKVDVRALRSALVKAEKEKERKRKTTKPAKGESARKPRALADKTTRKSTRPSFTGRPLLFAAPNPSVDRIKSRAERTAAA